jgi:hypothetical protein
MCMTSQQQTMNKPCCCECMTNVTHLFLAGAAWLVYNDDSVVECQDVLGLVQNDHHSFICGWHLNIKPWISIMMLGKDNVAHLFSVCCDDSVKIWRCLGQNVQWFRWGWHIIIIQLLTVDHAVNDQSSSFTLPMFDLIRVMIFRVESRDVHKQGSYLRSSMPEWSSVMSALWFLTWRTKVSPPSADGEC